jgi:hypothetical protein
VYLIDLVDEPMPFDSYSSAIEPDGEVMLWSDARTEKALKQVTAFVKRVGADAIVTADEFTQLWLAQSRNHFEPNCRVLAADAELLERILKKPEQVGIAREAGFNVLPSWEMHTRKDAALIPANDCPVCVRPGEPDSVKPMFKAMVLETPEALKEFLATVEWRNEPLLVQTYCFGPNIVVHGVCDLSGHMIDMCAYLAYRKSRGFAVSLRPYRLPADVRKACIRFVETAGVTGAFHFDLLQSAQSGKIYYLEINVRMGGTTPKVMRMGYDEPMMMLQSFGVAAPVHAPRLGRFRNSVTGKRSAIVHFIDVLLKRKDPLSYPHTNYSVDVFSALWETISVPDVLFNLRDLRGSLWYLLRVNRAKKIKA